MMGRILAGPGKISVRRLSQSRRRSAMTPFDMPYVLFGLLFLLSMAVLETGYRVGQWSGVNEDESYHEQISGLRDSLLVMLSLLLGFTFAMGISHFELRRQLLIDEANAIGTTSLRAQTLPEPQQSSVSRLIRQYVDARLEYSRADRNTSQEQAAARRSQDLQNSLWEQTAAVSRQDRTPVFGLFMQSVNEMIDLSEKRTAAREHRIPGVIWSLVTIIALLASFTTGYGLSKRFWFPAVRMPLMFAAAVALIADLDSPTRGFIRATPDSLMRVQQSLPK